MNFARFPKFAFLSLPAGVLALVLAGCGSSNNVALTPGNWSMTATPTSGGSGAFYIGGNLKQTGTSVAGTLYVVNSNCYSPSTAVTFTGTVKGNSLTLTSTGISGQVIAVTSSAMGSSSFSGTYMVTGGCDGGDTGNLSANTVPSITGTWSGPVASHGGVSQGGPNAALAFTLTQAASASGDGTFALTGSGTFTNSSCSNTATVDQAFIAGPYLLVIGLTDDGGSYSYEQVLLNNPATPTSMQGTYQVSGGNCDGDFDEPTFSKQ